MGPAAAGSTLGGGEGRRSVAGDVALVWGASWTRFYNRGDPDTTGETDADESQPFMH